ncbi:zinc finger MYND domain-containing protein [Aspergillus aculeatinus CBS 121060]|uniref:Uncharacterized protein n=1 Tax=Aspergillus aculeatinus CBS 121060 TaxID=1448322 RepID=A0ACD1GXU3_9EURO|nr:hypothetical protein BO66DRAFT_474617 [Aspergillus aculeatinus CBS 121060]RAH66005.1 hypothetical protein BO66DRAFT_474617 [Aspergillus aculeatinus CBS 121060]
MSDATPTCTQARYCSSTCQAADWKRGHRRTCAGAQKHKCFLIRALPITTNTTTTTDPNQPPKDAHYLEPFPLDAYGDWGKERQEIQARLNWTAVYESGTFFSHQKTNDWHYHVYAAAAAGELLPINPPATRCLSERVRGDVVVVRSSATDVNDYEEAFSATELARTLGYYRTVEDVKAERERRERERIAAKFGLDEKMLPPRIVMTMP